MKLGSICYLPPAHIGQPKAFLVNLERNPPAYPLYFYTDVPWRLKSIWQPPARIRSPEAVRDMRNAWSIPKLAFIEGINVAMAHGLDYFIMLEDDCRVIGKDWDKAIFDDFFSTHNKQHVPPLCGGTFYAFNMSNDDIGWSKSFWDWVMSYGQVISRNPPTLLVFGGPGCAEKQDAKIFTNGALTVYHTMTLAQMLPLQDKLMLARTGSAYDVTVGQGLRAKYGVAMFDRLVPLQTVFSYYGNCLYNEQERMAMLNSMKVRAVHQIKSAWTGPSL